MSNDNVNDVKISASKTIENFSMRRNFNWIPYESSMGAEFIPVNAVIAGFDINKFHTVFHTDIWCEWRIL